MSCVLLNSPYVPTPWIVAHGFNASVLQPTSRGEHASVAGRAGICAYVTAWVSEALTHGQVAAIVMATTCDQMRRAYEVVIEQAKVPCHLFNLPVTWQGVQAIRQYRDEVTRLGRFLINIGGSEPDEATLLSRLLSEGASEVASDRSGLPLAVLGPHGPVNSEPWLELLHGAGGQVMLDCTQPSSPVYDRRNLTCDPFNEMVTAWFGSMAEIFQRPNDRFYAQLKQALAITPVRGLIVRRFLWCDLWHAEVHRIRQEMDLPVLDLELAQWQPGDTERLANRLQAFVEMVR